MHPTKTTVLGTHITVALALGYVAFLVMNRKRVPPVVGYLMAGISVVVLASHAFLYMNPRKECSDNTRHLSRNAILGVHVVVSLGLAALSYQIINSKAELPVIVGYLLAGLSISILGAHTYFYMQKGVYCEDKKVMLV